MTAEAVYDKIRDDAKYQKLAQALDEAMAAPTGTSAICWSHRAVPASNRANSNSGKAG